MVLIIFHMTCLFMHIMLALRIKCIFCCIFKPRCFRFYSLNKPAVNMESIRQQLFSGLFLLFANLYTLIDRLYGWT